MATRTMGLWAAATFVIAAAALGASALREPEAADGRRPTWVEDQTTGTTGDVLREVPGARPVQPSEEAAAEPAGPPTSRPSTKTRQPANAAASAAKAPTRPLPEDPGTAGSPVSYTDDAGDAHWFDRTSTLNQPAYDILRVGWAPASYVDEQQRGGYATSITVAGAARDDAYYISYGEFYSDVPGETCQLYHILAPGITAYANAFCGSDAGTRRLIGQMEGSRVISKRTATGGTTLVATFDDSALPAFVEAGGRMLWELSALTCADLAKAGVDCVGPDPVDYAGSRVDYRL